MLSPEKARWLRKYVDQTFDVSDVTGSAPVPDEAPSEGVAATQAMPEADHEVLLNSPPPQPGMAPEEASAPESAFMPAPPMVSAQPRQQFTPKPPDDARNESELHQAKAADLLSRRNQALDLGVRQFLSTITKTPLSSTTLQTSDETDKVRGDQRAEKGDYEKKYVEFLRGQAGQTKADTLAGYNEEKLLSKFQPKPAAQMTPYQSKLVDLRESDQSLRKESEDRKTKAAADKLAGRAKAAAVAGETAKIPFGEGIFEPRAGTSPDKEVRHKLGETLGHYSAALGGTQQLEAALGEWAKAPTSVEARDKVAVAARLVAGELNTAYGQGAMSMDEANQMKQVLGAGLGTPDAVKAIVESFTGNPGEAGTTAARRARAVQETIKTLAIGRAKPGNYEFKGGKAADTAAPAPERVIQKNGRVFVKRGNQWFERKSE